MSLLTVQRSPSPSGTGGDTPDNLSSDLGDGLDPDSSGAALIRSRRFLLARKRFRKCLTGIRFVSRLRLSESYLSFKGAALILPKSEWLDTVTKRINTDIHTHLQSMFNLLRPQDTIKMAIKLESTTECVIRYMAVVSCVGVQDTEESVIVGFDIQKQEATIGLILPIWADMAIQLDGDGGFSITTGLKHHIFKPVSVQAMWSAWQSLNKIHDLARAHCYYMTGLTHTWVQYYKINSPHECTNEWNIMEDLESQRDDVNLSGMEQLEHRICAKLKEIMMTVDLEEVTSIYLRNQLEEAFGMDLKMYKQYIDQETIVIMRQMDSPSQIFDFLYLGSEWNASNMEELNRNKIGYILNVTREIDNFFPHLYTYKNIRVYDVEETDLLKYWEQTYNFICKARRNKSKVLVHCKMGISRSASTVISFAMKDNNWTLDQALRYVKSKRSVIHPNDGFMKQLKIYEGILGASNQRHSKLWRSTSVGNLTATAEEQEEEELYKGTDLANPPCTLGTIRHDSLPMLIRPQSWSPHNESADILLKTPGSTSRDESSEESFDLSEEETEEPAQFMMEDDTGANFQSTIKWDDAFHDNMGHGRDKKDDPPSSPVVLVSCAAREKKVEPEQDKVESESESENSMDSGTEGRHIAGGYDVTALESVQEEALYSNTASSPSPGMNYESESLLRQHPDLILELTEQRSQHRTREFHHTPQVIVSESIKHSTNQVPLSSNLHVKPDDFWIKDEQPSVTGDQDQQSEISDKHIDQELIPASEGVSQSLPTTDHSPVGSASSDISESMQPYIKEAIPWSPGTVRRHAQDLEGRMTTSDIPIMSDLSSSPQSHSQTTSRQSRRDTDRSSQSMDTTILSSLDAQPSNQSYSPSGPHSSDYNDNSDGNSTASTSVESLNESATSSRVRTTSCIYQSEDISLEPGHVLRTKQEIEHRERSSSYKEMSPEIDAQSVQRSSSFKENRLATSSRFDRNSERRKTCLPVLNHSPLDKESFSVSKTNEYGSSQVDVSVDQENNTAGSHEHVCQFGDDEKDAGHVVAYNICDEVVEIEDGKVKRQARDFEGVAIDVAAAVHKDEGNPEYAADYRSHPILLDEDDIHIQQGSVWKAKQNMLEKFAVGTKTSGTNCQLYHYPIDQDVIEASQLDMDNLERDPAEDPKDKTCYFHRKLKHSQSSPQLCLGALAYPEEEEITWSVGTVQHHKKSFEMKAKDPSQSSYRERHHFKSCLSDRTLLLIQQVGTAWMELQCDKSAAGDSVFTNGLGMVRQLTDQIQGRSTSEQIERLLKRYEHEAFISGLNFHGLPSVSSPWKCSLSRSASMHETSPRIHDSLADHKSLSGRSKYMKHRICHKKDLLKKDTVIEGETSFVDPTHTSQHSSQSGTSAEGIKRKASIKVTKEYFESEKSASNVVVSKRPLTRKNATDAHSNMTEGSLKKMFKTTCNVVVSTVSETSGNDTMCPLKNTLVGFGSEEIANVRTMSDGLGKSQSMNSNADSQLAISVQKVIGKDLNGQSAVDSKFSCSKTRRESAKSLAKISTIPMTEEEASSVIKNPESSQELSSLFARKYSSSPSHKDLSGTAVDTPPSQTRRMSCTQNMAKSSVLESGFIYSDISPGAVAPCVTECTRDRVSTTPPRSRSTSIQKDSSSTFSTLRDSSSSPPKECLVSRQSSDFVIPPKKSLVGFHRGGLVVNQRGSSTSPSNGSSFSIENSHLISQKNIPTSPQRIIDVDPLASQMMKHTNGSGAVSKLFSSSAESTRPQKYKNIDTIGSHSNTSVRKPVSSPDNKSPSISMVSVSEDFDDETNCAIVCPTVIKEGTSPEVHKGKTVEVNIKDLMDIFQGQLSETSESQKVPLSSDCIKGVSIKCETRERSNSSPVNATDFSGDQSASDPLMKSEGTTSDEVDILLNPTIKEQAIKALFPEYRGEAGKSVHRVGVKGTRRHRRSTLGLVRDRSSDPCQITKTSLKPQPKSVGTITTHKPITSRGNFCVPEVTRELQKVRKLHGKSHPLSRLTQEETSESSVTQGRSKNPFYNTL